MLRMFGSNSTVFTFISKRFSSLQHFFVKGHKTDSSPDTKFQTSKRETSHNIGSKTMVLSAEVLESGGHTFVREFLYIHEEIANA
jgi:hypothetical protein